MIALEAALILPASVHPVKLILEVVAVEVGSEVVEGQAVDLATEALEKVAGWVVAVVRKRIVKVAVIFQVVQIQGQPNLAS